MIWVFDLDDTLYNEKEFVLNGFFKVAKYLKKKFKISNSYNEIKKIHFSRGRKEIFNKILKKNNIFTLKTLNKCISIYRSNNIKLSLKPEIKKFLKKNIKKNYIVTDGMGHVQKLKIKKLNLKKYFNRIFYTGYYGKKARKPSLYCFKKIKKIENCRWSDIIYVGDNPHKDFKNLNKKNVLTIRIKKGLYRNVVVKKKDDATVSIVNFNELNKFVKKND